MFVFELRWQIAATSTSSAASDILDPSDGLRVHPFCVLAPIFIRTIVMGNLLQRISGNRGSLNLQTPPDAKKTTNDDSCEKSPAPLPVEEGSP